MTELDLALAEASAVLKRIRRDRAVDLRMMLGAYKTITGRRLALIAGRPECCTFDRAERARQTYHAAAEEHDDLVRHEVAILAAVGGGHAARRVPSLPRIERLRPPFFHCEVEQ